VPSTDAITSVVVVMTLSTLFLVGFQFVVQALKELMGPEPNHWAGDELPLADRRPRDLGRLNWIRGPRRRSEAEPGRLYATRHTPLITDAAQVLLISAALQDPPR
jgi:hypothetical protein